MRLSSGWKKGRGTDISASLKKKKKRHMESFNPTFEVSACFKGLDKI